MARNYKPGFLPAPLMARLAFLNMLAVTVGDNNVDWRMKTLLANAKHSRERNGYKQRLPKGHSKHKNKFVHRER